MPSIGTRVIYRLSEEDANRINRRRTTGQEIAMRIASIPREWPLGAQAHIGSEVKAADAFPGIVVRSYEIDRRLAVNLQVFLDGSDALWVEDPPLEAFTWT